MQKKKDTKKFAKRLAPEMIDALKKDIKEKKGTTNEIAKRHKVSPQTVKNYRKKIIQEKKDRAPNALELKRALDLSKADSLLVLAMENMGAALQRVEKDLDGHKPAAQAKIAVDVARTTLEIRNALVFTDLPPLDTEGYGPEDVELNEMIMSMLTEKQQEELFEKFTGTKARDYKKPRDDTDSKGQSKAGVLPEKSGGVRDKGAGGKTDS